MCGHLYICVASGHTYVQHVCGHLLVLHLLHPSNMCVARLVLHLLPSVSPASVQCGRHGRHMPFVVYTLWLYTNPTLLVVEDISQGEIMKCLGYLST